MEYVQMTLSDWMEIKEKIRKDMNNVKHAFVRVGYNLRRIRDGELYKQDGYDNLTDFAREELGIGASWVSRLISVNEAYSVDGYSETLLPQYEDYKQSALIEMLSLPEADRQMVTPETPREDIRELKRFNKEAAGADDLQEVMEAFCEADRDLARTLYEGIPEEKLQEVINPSGSRVFKKGLFFLSFIDKVIKIKKFGSDPRNMTYQEFAVRIAGIAEEKLAAGEWEEAEIAPAQNSGQPQEISAESEIREKENEEGNRGESQQTGEEDRETAEAAGDAVRSQEGTGKPEQPVHEAAGGTEAVEDEMCRTGEEDQTGTGAEAGGEGTDPASGSISGGTEQAAGQPEPGKEEQLPEEVKLEGQPEKENELEEALNQEIAPAQNDGRAQELKEKIGSALRHLTEDIRAESWLSAEMRVDQLRTYLQSIRNGTTL